MDASYLNDWLAFLLRWLHVIAAIVWIGTSFYFVALDNHLRPPKRRGEEGDVGGETWEIHGGGFYRIEKYRVAPDELPEPLHWFKWEAYTTWLSGFALFVAIYYVDAELYLIDPAVADLERWQAIALSAGLLVAGWLVYTALCRALRERELLLAAWCRRLGGGDRLRAQRALLGAWDGDPARRNARDDHGRERLLRDHPGPLGPRPREAGGP